MKVLTIVRHAKSSWSDTDCTDRQRTLNRRGERDAPKMADRIAAHDIRPSLIMASPAVRAWSTAKIVAAKLGYPLEFLQREDDLYLASVDAILNTLLAQDDAFNSIMIVGHNPGLTEFANYLSPGVTDNLPTAGVVSVSFQQDDWNLITRPATELICYDFPKNSPRDGA